MCSNPAGAGPSPRFAHDRPGWAFKRREIVGGSLAAFVERRGRRLEVMGLGDEVKTWLFAIIVCAALTGFAYGDELPLNPAVTQSTIASTICVPGWTKTVRPSPRYTNRIKIALIRELEIPEELLVDFELDHRIPLALGGAPSDSRNLELQPWDEAGDKDAIEACLARAVCAGKITLDDARRRIWTDWRAARGVCE